MPQPTTNSTTPTTIFSPINKIAISLLTITLVASAVIAALGLLGSLPTIALWTGIGTAASSLCILIMIMKCCKQNSFLKNKELDSSNSLTRESSSLKNNPSSASLHSNTVPLIEPQEHKKTIESCQDILPSNFQQELVEVTSNFDEENGSKESARDVSSVVKILHRDQKLYLSIRIQPPKASLGPKVFACIPTEVSIEIVNNQFQWKQGKFDNLEDLLKNIIAYFPDPNIFLHTIRSIKELKVPLRSGKELTVSNPIYVSSKSV